MARESLSEKLARIQREKGTDIGLILRPQLSKMPLPMQRYDDPFLPFGKAIIDATRDLVCGVMFDLASYMALGAASMVALERTIAYAKADMVTIIDAPFLAGRYAFLTDEASFNVDGFTVMEPNNAAIRIEPFDFRLHWIGDEAVYAGHGDDFAEQARNMIETTHGIRRNEAD